MITFVRERLNRFMEYTCCPSNPTNGEVVIVKDNTTKRQSDSNNNNHRCLCGDLITFFLFLNYIIILNITIGQEIERSAWHSMLFPENITEHHPPAHESMSKPSNTSAGER